MITKEEFLQLVGSFTWSFHNTFLVEIPKHGSFIWSCPNYPGGDNTIRPFHGSYKKWCREMQIPFGRDKGSHRIIDYCGSDITLCLN